MKDPLNIIWHDSPEEVQRAMWAPVAAAEGIPLEELEGALHGGLTADGEEVEVSHEDVIEGLRQQRCWGFVDTNTCTVHAWAADDADPALVVHMLAHELGHITGAPCEDPLQEEMRAEQFGEVAAQAFRLFAQRQQTVAAA